MNADLLICDCGDCRHWELGKDFIRCVTCGTVFHIAPDHIAAFDAAVTDLEGRHERLKFVPHEL